MKTSRQKTKKPVDDASDPSSAAARGRARAPRENVTLAAAFDAASAHVRAHPLTAEELDLLELYALYKAGTVGKCNVERPSSFNFERAAMWDAWNNLREMPREEAQRCYLEALTVLLPRWQRLARVRFLGRRFGGPATAADLEENPSAPAPGDDTDADGDDAADNALEESEAEEEDVLAAAEAEARALEAARASAYSSDPDGTGAKPPKKGEGKSQGQGDDGDDAGGKKRMGPVASNSFNCDDDFAFDDNKPKEAADNNGCEDADAPDESAKSNNKEDADATEPKAAAKSAAAAAPSSFASHCPFYEPATVDSPDLVDSGAEAVSAYLDDAAAAYTTAVAEAGAEPAAERAAAATLRGAVNAVDRHGRGVLHVAADAGDTDVLEAVAAALKRFPKRNIAVTDGESKGWWADVTAADIDGVTALMYAVWGESAEAVALLLAIFSDDDDDDTGNKDDKSAPAADDAAGAEGAAPAGGYFEPRMPPGSAFARGLVKAGVVGSEAELRSKSGNAAEGDDVGLTARECAELVGNNEIINLFVQHEAKSAVKNAAK